MDAEERPNATDKPGAGDGRRADTEQGDGPVPGRKPHTSTGPDAGPNAGPDDGPRHPAVRVRIFRRHLELSFESGFTDEDVATVKAIWGRRWIPDRGVWTLPNTSWVLGTLRSAMGPRVVLTISDDDAVAHPSWAPAQNQAQAGAQARIQAPPQAQPRGHSQVQPQAQPQVQPQSRPTRPPGPGAGTPPPHDRAEALLATFRRTIRAREYSRKTERAYLGWARRFVRFHATTVERPDDLDGSHARDFLEHLANEEGLSAGSRNQAASALSFLFREVLGRDELADVPRAKGPKRVPLVLTHREVLRVLRELTGKYFVIAMLLYSAGLRLEECLRLRLKDVDFELRQILVRDGKGRKDRYAPLAHRAAALVRAQIGRVAERHATDRAQDHGWAALPGALHRKDPAAGYDLGWQFLFPATTLNADPATGRLGRGPLHPTAVQREVKAAVRRSGIPKRATCHTFRHSFATEALRGGCDIRTLQHVMGHKDLRTTTIYLHVVEQTGLHIRSPLDRPDDLDPYDIDPVDMPWGRPDYQWTLASRQWDASDASHPLEPGQKGPEQGSPVPPPARP